MRADADTEPLRWDGTLALVLFVLQSAATALYVNELGSIILLGVLHVASAVAAWSNALNSGPPPRRQALLLALMTTAMGAVGAAGSFLCILFEWGFRPYATPFTKWFESIFQDERDDADIAFFDRLAASDDPVIAAQRVMSFRDVLGSGTIEQRLAIVALIAQRFTPAFAPALRQALDDPVLAVRVQAAAAAAAIEGRYSQKLLKLSRGLSERSAAPGDHREAALHLIEFADCGIAEAQRTEDARRSALTHLEAVLKSAPLDVEALTLSGKLLLILDEPVLAHERIQRAARYGGQSPDIVPLQIEALMRLGRYHDLRQLAQSYLRRAPEPGVMEPSTLSSLQLWAGSVQHA